MKVVYFLVIVLLICSCGRKLTMSFTPVDLEFQNTESALVSRAPLTVHNQFVVPQKEAVQVQDSPLLVENETVRIKELVVAQYQVKKSAALKKKRGQKEKYLNEESKDQKVKPKFNRKAVLSMVLGILALLVLLLFMTVPITGGILIPLALSSIFVIPSLILAKFSLQEIQKNKEQRGKGMALTGLILSTITVAIAVLFSLLVTMVLLTV